VTARERYVRELERRLPFALGLRRRALAEIREHLREGGDEALARFGPVEELADELARELRARVAVRASWLIPTLVAVFVFPFYVVPENTLPPAPWDVKPEYLAWKQQLAAGAWLVALAFAVAALVVGRVKPRLVVWPLLGSVSTLAVAVAFGSIVAVQWLDAVPGSSAALAYAGIAASLMLLVVGALVLVEAYRSALRDCGSELAPD